MALSDYLPPTAIKTQPFNANPLGAPPTGLFGMGRPGQMFAGGPGGLVRPSVMPQSVMPAPAAPIAPVIPAATALAPATPQQAVANALMGQRRVLPTMPSRMQAY